jgi:hypothetical protein
VFYPAFICIGSAASAQLLPLYHMSNLFPGHEGLAMSILNGSFDASSLVYFIMARLYAAGVPFRTVLIAYLLGPVLLVGLFSVFLWRPAPFAPQALAATAAPTPAAPAALGGEPSAAVGDSANAKPLPADAAPAAATVATEPSTGAAVTGNPLGAVSSPMRRAATQTRLLWAQVRQLPAPMPFPRMPRQRHSSSPERRWPPRRLLFR